MRRSHGRIYRIELALLASKGTSSYLLPIICIYDLGRYMDSPLSQIRQAIILQLLLKRQIIKFPCQNKLTIHFFLRDTEDFYIARSMLELGS